LKSSDKHMSYSKPFQSCGNIKIIT
jgi:hypothetical protein